MKTFYATMDKLRWCRVEDVLRWIEWNSPCKDYFGMYIESMHLEGMKLEIPCDQFTASVIMRASENLRDKAWKACVWRSSIYDGECNFLAFWDEPNPHHNANVCGSFYAPFNPDTTEEKTQWTREWVETVLKGLG